MIAVFVTFAAEGGLDRDALAQIAAKSREMFEGLPGLRAKGFTVDEDGRRARNVYVWEDEGAARAFFSDEMVDRIAAAYGTRPKIEFAQLLEFVDNSAA